ncbi:MAG: Cu [Lasallia pustulata]|uniref:Cu n=1 Tax=Lasallia pustulata TaxID=136370 RepID=A0A5M8PQJ2_9LECA|nr:MAG: Cu [Lasallia pustulata]
MRASTILSILPLALLTHAQVASIDGPIIPGTTGKLGDAAITRNNPAGVTYTAVLPNSNTTGIRGFVSGTSNANGTGVVFTMNLSGFPSAALGPFLYHIHNQPVPTNGSCAGTLAHLDPYIRGDIPPCDPTQPETCQVGDLSGKHGNITTSPFIVS